MEVGQIYNTGQGLRASLQDWVMLPNQAHRPAIEVRVQRSVTGGLNVAEFFYFEEAGMQYGLSERTLSPEQLSDLYEVMHHRLHGHDVRGLDPQVQLTRLTAPGQFPALPAHGR